MSPTAARLYVVLIEWGGQKPPSMWYRYLEKLAGLQVRPNGGGQSQMRDVISSRQVDTRGVTFQEGCIICPSLSLARTIAAFALNSLFDGSGKPVQPKAIQIGTAELEPTFHLTEADEQALQRISAVFGKRGPKGDPKLWHIACMEELITHEAERHELVNCPVCGSLQVRVGYGAAPRYADPGGHLLDAWRRLRFGTGAFLIPLPGTDTPPVDPTVTSPAEQGALVALFSSPLALQLERLDRELALRILDAIFVSRLYWSKERRMKHRLEAITRFFQMGGNPAGVMLDEPPLPDVFDAAAFIAPATIAGLALEFANGGPFVLDLASATVKTKK